LVWALAREIGQAVFPGMPDRRLVAVRHERLRENLSHAHVILDQEELHPPPSRPSGTPPSSQGHREFFKVTRGREDGILRRSSSKVRAVLPSRRIPTWGIPRGDVPVNADQTGLPDRRPPKAVPERPLTDYRPLLDGSPAMRAIRTVIDNIADTDAT